MVNLIAYNMNTKQLVEQEKDLEEGTETEKSENEKDEEKSAKRYYLEPETEDKKWKD